MRPDMNNALAAIQRAMKRRGMNMPEPALNQMTNLTPAGQAGPPPVPQTPRGDALPGQQSRPLRTPGQQPQSPVQSPNPEAEIILKAMSSRLKQL